MPLGLNSTMNVTFEQIENLTNSSNFPEFLLKVNTNIYEGHLFFILLVITFVVLFLLLQKRNDQMLNNILYSSVVVSILSLLLRGVYVSSLGIGGLLTDFQMWLFPLITVVLVLVVWSGKED